MIRLIVRERVSELIINHALFVGSTRNKLIEILEEINDFTKNSLLTESDINAITKRQEFYFEIKSIIEAIQEKNGDAFELNVKDLHSERNYKKFQ